MTRPSFPRFPGVARRRRRFGRLLTIVTFPALLGTFAGCGGDASSSSVGQDEQEGAQTIEAADSLDSGYPLRIKDATGNTLELQHPPTRILSLVPSVTRTIGALGAGSLLVGRTEYDTDPSLAHLPSVGGGLEPNLEAVVLLEPDLVIRFAGESDPDTPARLSELGIPHFAIRLDRVADVERLFSDLGRILETQDAAAREIREIHAVRERITREVLGQEPVRVAYVLGGDPPWVAGGGTFIDELLTLAGGANVFGDIQNLYGPVSMETFLVRKIDVVLAPEGTELTLPDAGFSVLRVSADLELPGPDLAASAMEIAAALHPERFR